MARDGCEPCAATVGRIAPFPLQTTIDERRSPIVQRFAPISLPSLRARSLEASRAGRALGALALAIVAGCATPAVPRDPDARLDASAIDESKLVVLAGNTHPKADAAHDAGAVDDGLVLEHMQLLLRRSPEQEAKL